MAFVVPLLTAPKVTAIGIIKRAMRLIGVYSMGEELTADESADGLLALNSMMSLWALEKLMLYKFETVSHTPTTSSFTIGPTGTVVTARPIEILSAYRQVGGVDYPVDIISRVQYENLMLKGQTGLTSGIYYKPTFPDGTVYCWPVPQGNVLNMTLQQALTEFILTGEIQLPPGYTEALAFNLAVAFAPEFDVEASLTVQKRAMNSKRLIKGVNNEIPQLESGLVGHGNHWWVPPQ